MTKAIKSKALAKGAKRQPVAKPSRATDSGPHPPALAAHAETPLPAA